MNRHTARHIRDVIRDTPELARYLRAFGDRLRSDIPFTEAELSVARLTLASVANQAQSTFPFAVA